MPRGPSTNNTVGSGTSKLPAPAAPIKSFSSPADARPAPWPDAAGWSDYNYFVAHPDINGRIRLPFANEIAPEHEVAPQVAPELMGQGARRAFIHVSTIRNSDGSPGTRARGIFYSNGGTA